MDTIQFHDITFQYDHERGNVLDAFTLSIKKGEWLGIVGSSGAGKTTIFDLLLQFYYPQMGRIRVDGVDIQEISTSSLRSKITLVSQDTFLFPGTIQENLLYANPMATDEEMHEVLNMVYLDDLVQSLPEGMHTEIGENGILLSGGEKQRLCLARGLLRDCEIILLDEVTANIDKASEENIKNTLKEIKKTRDMTIVAISHRLDFLEDVDRIVVVESGRVTKELSYKEYAASSL